MKALDALDAELFDVDTDIETAPKFDIVACSQGQDAIDKARLRQRMTVIRSTW